MDELLTMTGKEINRLNIMQKLNDKRLKQREEAEMLGVSVRQDKRLLKAFKEKGAKGLVSKHREKESNNRLKEELVKQVLDLIQSKYAGFGPTLAHEKLVEIDKLNLSDESERKIMITEGI